MADQKQSQVAQGNTNTLSNSKNKNFARFFQLTLNNEKNGDVNACNTILDDKYYKVLSYLQQRKQLKYLISCKEINKKGFYHIHIYCQFEKYTKLSIKKLEGAHVEICRGSVDENINYIKKDGNIINEFGTKILNYNKLSIKDVIENASDEELLNCDIRFINCINYVKNNSIKWIQPPLNCEKEIIFITNKQFNDNQLSDFFKHCHCISYNYKNNHFTGLHNKIFINLNDYIDFENKTLLFNVMPLFGKFNTPINCINQSFYPYDIKKVVFYYNESILDPYVKNWFKFYKGFFRNMGYDKENPRNYIIDYPA